MSICAGQQTDAADEPLPIQSERNGKPLNAHRAADADDMTESFAEDRQRILGYLGQQLTT